MPIIIQNWGPLKDKVTVSIGGEFIAFSTCSFVKLENLMIALGAKRTDEENPIPGESHWTLDRGEENPTPEKRYWPPEHDDVRERAHSLQSIALEDMASKLASAQADAVAWRSGCQEEMTKKQELQDELADLQHANWWQRLRWVFRGR